MAKRWLPPAQPTPVQVLLLEYMWSARPPLDLTRLAHRIDIPENTVRAWFNPGRIPHPARLRQVALHTGIPLGELYRATGFDVPTPAQPLAYAPAYLAPLFDRLEARVRDLPDHLTPAARRTLIEEIQSVRRGEVDQFAAEKQAEHRVVEAEPVPQTATDEEITATDRQHEAPRQVTRTTRRPRREMARRQP